MSYLENPVGNLLETWAACEADKLHAIRHNVASITAVPWAVWQKCGGYATRDALLALAEAGAEVYAYPSGHYTDSPLPPHYNVWIHNQRIDLLDLNSNAALASLLTSGKEASK